MTKQLQKIQNRIKNLKKQQKQAQKDLEAINANLEQAKFYETYSYGKNYLINIPKWEKWLKKNHKRFIVDNLSIQDRLDRLYSVYLLDGGSYK